MPLKLLVKRTKFIRRGDIDIDCIESDRPAIFEHITSRFGSNKTARVASFGTMQDKGVMDDVGRALGMKWSESHPGALADDNPWSLKRVAKIKSEYDTDPEKTKRKYPELFYYFDGLLDTKISQSVHPAGMVISPITLPDNYGVFDKEGDNCLFLDMENIHDFTGLAKYDFLVLKTVQVIRDTCRYLGKPYPKTHEINWNDQEVWNDIVTNPSGIFQFEGKFAFDCLKKFKPKSIFDMSLVTACIRPSGASYRDDLLAKKPHRNPSEIIDKLLEDNLGYLCIEGNQKVDTKRGFIPIKDVRVGDFVKTRSGFQKVLDARKTGHKELLDLKFLGNHLLVTPEHKILTDRGWVESKKLRAGDIVAYRVGDPIICSEIDPNLSKIIGWLMGDGTITELSKIHFDNRSRETARAFGKAIGMVYEDLECSTVHLRTCKDGSILYRTRVRFKEGKAHRMKNPLVRDLRKMGLLNRTAVDKFIPTEIMTSNVESQLSFIGSYTDTDSMVSFKKNTVLVTYTTASQQLAYDLQTMLRNLGFAASVNEEINAHSGAYHIVVSNAAEYLELIKNYSVKCTDALKTFQRPAVNARKVHSKIHKDIVIRWLKEHHITSKQVQVRAGINIRPVGKGANYTSVHSMKKISKEFKIQIPKEFRNDNIIWTELREISTHDSEDVYDITVDNEHEFVCQGIVVHNCYQEDTIKFLQQICGLSGSEADNIRRAIGRKQKDRLDKAMPDILNGYCEKSDKPREEAEQEAKQFLQILEDSASYQFGYNHSIAYCLLGYLCGYYRHYYPLQFITAFLNDAANEDDIRNGTSYANRIGIQVTMPKWGISRGEYAFDIEKNIISKGLSSVKYMGSKVADELHELAHDKSYKYFVDVLRDIDQNTSVDLRQMDILIKLDFFSEFGNQRELLRISEMFNDVFKKGDAKKISKSKVDGTPLEPIVKKYSVGVTKSGGEAKSYTLLDVMSILHEVEDAIKAVHMEDLDDITKVRNFKDAMGYIGYVSGKQEDRRKLYVVDIFPVMRKKDGKQFGYSLVTKSIGSGKESRFTVFNRVFNQEPIAKNDIIYCKSFERDGIYFTLTGYNKIY